tara:strand:+ start:1742 stop:2200 length:459 start_codon:yes stop_codon:yes gene_type:complete
MSVKEKLKSLNIDLPKAPNPVGSYVAHKKIGNLIYISGQLPIKSDGQLIKGKLGENLNLEQGQEAAYFCCLNIISQLKASCNDDLDKIKNCIKITGFVNSVDAFTDQPKVINPASELLVKLFDAKGKHTRAAVSVNSLPLGAAVEIDAIFET